MNIGKIYIEWVMYLKKKGIYAQYMYEYARTNEMLAFKHYLIDIGQYFDCGSVLKVRKLNHRFFNSKDYLIPDKGDEMSFNILKRGIELLIWYRSDWDDGHTKRNDWSEIVLDFGEECGYYKKPVWQSEPNGGWYFALPEAESASASTLREGYRVTTTHHGNTRYEEAHAGQWYDRYYNGGRNNNRNNNRWRR